MAKSLNRGLGALAALGALSYHLSKSGGRTDGGAPVDDRNTGSSRPRETFRGLDDSGAASGDDIARFADVGTNFNETGEPYSLMATPGAAPAAGGTRSLAAPRPSASRPAMNDREQVFDAPTPSTASDAAAMFRARERAERGTPAMRNPNISEEVAQRTGVKLNSMAGASRGIEGGPAPGEIEEFRTNPANISRAVSRRTGVKLDSKAGAGRGGQGGPTARQLAEYQQEKERERMRGRGYNTARKEGGAIKTKKMASGGMTSASKRADGIATKGKTKCKMY